MLTKVAGGENRYVILEKWYFEMETKNSRALLLSGAVLFSVMGSVKVAKASGVIQNEIDIINKGEPVVINSTEENRAPCINEEDQKVGDLKLNNEIKNRTEELLGGGKNIDIPDNGREYVVVNRMKGLKTEEDINNELEVAVHMSGSGPINLQFYNESMRDYFEGESVSRDLANRLGLEGVPYVRPGNKDKKLDNQKDVKGEQGESFRIEKSNSNVDVNSQECKPDFPKLKKEEEGKKQDEKTELNNEEINYTNNDGNDFNINNEKREPEALNSMSLDLNNAENDIKNNWTPNEPAKNVEGLNLSVNECYEEVTKQKVGDRIAAANLRAVNDIVTVKNQNHSTVIEQEPQKILLHKALTTVKSVLVNAWSGIKRGLSFVWSKVTSGFKWK
ncbi:MAG: hypothetical protein IJT08_00520 [Alphaproteobacteria bacterium]|nr:hypothetical protein [Alphaproteobacteria bacterium]